MKHYFVALLVLTAFSCSETPKERIKRLTNEIDKLELVKDSLFNYYEIEFGVNKERMKIDSLTTIIKILNEEYDNPARGYNWLERTGSVLKAQREIDKDIEDWLIVISQLDDVKENQLIINLKKEHILEAKKQIHK